MSACGSAEVRIVEKDGILLHFVRLKNITSGQDKLKIKLKHQTKNEVKQKNQND